MTLAATHNETKAIVVFPSQRSGNITVCAVNSIQEVLYYNAGLGSCNTVPVS